MRREGRVGSALCCRKTSLRRKVGCRDETHHITSRTSASARRPASVPNRRPRKCAVSWRWLPLATNRQPPQHRMTRIIVHQSRLCVSILPHTVNCRRFRFWRHHHHHTTTVLQPFFRDHPGEPVPEQKFWTLWCKGRLTEADTATIRMGAISLWLFVCV